MSFFREPNANIVQVTAPWEAVTGGLGGTAGVSRTLLGTGHLSRIAKCGSVVGARVRFRNAVDKISHIKFQVWRPVSVIGDDYVYDMVGESEVFTTGWSDESTCDFLFGTPIPGVMFGDVMACCLTITQTESYIIATGNTGDTDDCSCLYTNDWRSGSGVVFSDYHEPLSSFMQASPLMQSPTCVLFGDSFTSTVDATPSFLRPLASGHWYDVVLGRGLDARLRDIDAALFDTMASGKGGSTSAQWANESDDWLTKYVIEYHPRFAVFSLGANDSSTGNLADVVGNITAITQRLYAAGITPVQLAVPHTATATWTKMFTWNQTMQSRANAVGYPYVDVRTMAADYDNPLQRNTNYFGAGIHGETGNFVAMAQQIATTLISRGW